MAGVFRVFARLGYAEGMSGHISVLDPIRTDAMWMNPLGVRSAQSVSAAGLGSQI